MTGNLAFFTDGMFLPCTGGTSRIIEHPLKASLPNYESHKGNDLEDVKPASTDRALDAAVNTPAAMWRHKDGLRASDGGREHMGLMAQDLQKTDGDVVAPGGKQIDFGDATGLVMATIQGLKNNVKRPKSAAARQAA